MGRVDLRRVNRVDWRVVVRVGVVGGGGGFGGRGGGHVALARFAFNAARRREKLEGGS